MLFVVGLELINTILTVGFQIVLLRIDNIGAKTRRHIYDDIIARAATITLAATFLVTWIISTWLLLRGLYSKGLLISQFNLKVFLSNQAILIPVDNIFHDSNNVPNKRYFLDLVENDEEVLAALGWSRFNTVIEIYEEGAGSETGPEEPYEGNNQFEESFSIAMQNDAEKELVQ